MIAKFNSRRNAFTLIELMVVVAIIAVLAALIVPGLQKAQAKSMTASCLSKVRGIGASVRTYSSSWTGWTHSDAHYYVKEMGKYKLSTEDNSDPALTSARIAVNSQVKDFICPIDSAPKVNDHQIRSSYLVLATNMNLMNQQSTVVLAAEPDKRHPISGKTATLGNNIVYSDLSSVTLEKDLYFPGAKYRIHNSTVGGAIWNVVRDDNDKLIPAQMEGIWSLDLAMVNFGLASFIGSNDDFNWEVPYTNVRDLSVRWDGYLDIPTDGDWQFRTDATDDHTWAWIDYNQNGQEDGGETFDRNSGIQSQTLVAGKYQFKYVYQEGTASDYFQLRWLAPGDTTWPNVPAKNIFYQLHQ